jgi:C-terminal processing protease CtpA/Prc
VRDYSQAKTLGIAKGDIIESINGQEAKNMKLQEIIEILQNTKKTTVRLKLNRKGKIVSVDLPLEDIL